MSLCSTIIETRSYRAATEDRAAVFEHPEGCVIVVADGVGGRVGGGRAAELVVASVARRLPALKSLHKAVTWHLLLEAVDIDLRKDGGGGETTAVVMAVTPTGLAGAAVGDSEAWSVMTATQQPVVLAGRNRRKPYLGYGMSTPESFVAGQLKGTLLIATDGLFKYADINRIMSAVRLDDLKNAAETLAELPKSSEGTYLDDLAIVLCRPHAANQ
jgi:serine/threonine protein phosphatase PrpC